MLGGLPVPTASPVAGFPFLSQSRQKDRNLGTRHAFGALNMTQEPAEGG